MSAYKDPGALRRKLQRELRRYRSAAGMTQASVAKEMDWSPSKVIRIESGQVSVSTNDLRVLLNHYGIKDSREISEIIDLSKASRQASRWDPFESDGSITSESATYFANESSAEIIRQFELSVFPGLLQTEEYMSVLFRDSGGRSGRHLENAISARLLRQELLERSDQPEMFFVLDVAMLRREAGGPAVLRRQLERLEDLSKNPKITIQIVPDSAGVYPGQQGPFTILEFTDDDPVLYLESRDETVTRETPEEIGRYLDIFQKLEQEKATPPTEIGAVLEEFKSKLERA